MNIINHLENRSQYDLPACKTSGVSRLMVMMRVKKYRRWFFRRIWTAPVRSRNSNKVVLLTRSERWRGRGSRRTCSRRTSTSMSCMRWGLCRLAGVRPVVPWLCHGPWLPKQLLLMMTSATGRRNTWRARSWPRRRKTKLACPLIFSKRHRQSKKNRALQNQ